MCVAMANWDAPLVENRWTTCSISRRTALQEPLLVVVRGISISRGKLAAYSLRVWGTRGEGMTGAPKRSDRDG